MTCFTLTSRWGKHTKTVEKGWFFLQILSVWSSANLTCFTLIAVTRTRLLRRVSPLLQLNIYSLRYTLKIFCTNLDPLFKEGAPSAWYQLKHYIKLNNFGYILFNRMYTSEVSWLKKMPENWTLLFSTPPPHPHS